MRALLAVVLLAVLGYAGFRLLGRDDESPQPTKAKLDEVRIGPYPFSQFYLEHDRFPAATDPKVVPAEDATWLRPDDEVFGVVLGGQARAYPVPMISYHHVVNDVIRGIPVAVTY